MAETESTEAAGLSSGRLVLVALRVAGGLLAVATTVWAVARFWELARLAATPEPPGASAIAAPAALLLAGWAAGVVLWAVAEQLRRYNELSANSNGAGGPLVPRPRPVDTVNPERQTRLLEQLVQLTRELRDIELLSEQDRAARLQQEGDELARQLQVDVPALLREHNWVEARRRVQYARHRFPKLGGWEALEQQIEQARAAVEGRDVENISRELNDLVALGAWDRVGQTLRALQQRHPDSPRVAELARRLSAAREKAEAEERARLMAQAQEASNDKDWTTALARVEAVLTRYPDAPEAADLRAQLETLRANAEIQTRHRMENEFRDLLRDHRYEEALHLARTIIAQYPDSPQAGVLRDQLPRLEQKAGVRT